MKKKIIAFERLEKPVFEELQKDFDIRLFKGIDPYTDADFIHFLHDAEGVIGLKFPADQEMLAKAPNLKIISNVSVGYNNLDLNEMTKRGIMATNTPGVLDDTVADMAMGLMLSAARRMPELDSYVKQGLWKGSLPTEWFGTDVHHKKLGIIGMGRIGREIARRGRLGFGMDILYHSRTRKPAAEEQFEAVYLSLEELLKQSDFVCVITPLTNETKELIGKKEFQLMKESAIFINVSRGATVVEEDLLEALKNGEIAAAGLDVYVQEPIDPSNELLQLKNVVTLPHIGSSTFETELKMAELAAENVTAGLRGDKLENLVNLEVWKE